jgi:hypothetical protein
MHRGKIPAVIMTIRLNIEPAPDSSADPPSDIPYRVGKKRCFLALPAAIPVPDSGLSEF